MPTSPPEDRPPQAGDGPQWDNEDKAMGAQGRSTAAPQALLSQPSLHQLFLNISGCFAAPDGPGDKMWPGAWQGHQHIIPCEEAQAMVC